MLNAFRLLGLRDIPAIHKILVDREKQTEPGVNVMIMRSISLKTLPTVSDVLKHTIDEVCISDDSPGDMFTHHVFKKSFQSYDNSCQYCIMFQIDNQIVGGAIIPFVDSDVLDLALRQALTTYQRQ